MENFKRTVLPNGEEAVLTKRILFLASVQYKGTWLVYLINNEKITLDGYTINMVDFI